MLTELIQSQIYECIIMLAAGVLAGIIRDVYDAFITSIKMRIDKSQKKEKVKKAINISLEWVGEIVFFTTVAVAAFSFLYYCCYGKITFHAFISFVAGVLLWKKIFYVIINAQI